jgi:hypothetical protein
LEDKSRDPPISSASLCSSNHTLLDALGAVEILDALFLKYVKIQFLHDLQDNVETLEEAIHGYTKHTICGSAIDGAKYGSSLVVRCMLYLLNSV